MSFEIPFDLIHQLQASLRKEANVSLYDPDDPSLPSLPTASQSISELDPSPPHLRCKNCEGRLLRGVQSVICVFCGKQLPQQSQGNQELTPEPINFRSTLGCKWLLESLNLDGSEKVGPFSEARESNRGQSATQDEVLLSDLLGLEIKWTAQLEEFDVRASDETLVQKKTAVNLASADLHKYSNKAKGDAVSAANEERLPPNESGDTSGNIRFQGRENLSLFESAKPSETAETSTQDDIGDSFSAWDADFQSADSKTVHEESKTGDPLLGSSVDLSTHMDSIFGSGKVKDKSVSSTSNASDWFQDDLWSSSSRVGDQAKQFEVAANSKDGGIVESNSNSSSVGIDWIQDNQWQTSSHEEHTNKTTNDNSGSFEAWSDFTSSTGAQDPSNIHEPPNKKITDKDDVSSDIWNDFTTSTTAGDFSRRAITHVRRNSNESGDKTINEDSDLFDAWNDFNSSTSAQDPSSKETVHHMTSSKAPDHKITDQEYGSFDVWNDILSSTGAKDPSNDSAKQTVNHVTSSNEALDSKTANQDNNSFDAWNDFASSTDAQGPSSGSTKDTISQLSGSKKAPDSKTSNQDDDPFHGWNDFTSSTRAQDPSNSSSNQTIDQLTVSNQEPDNRTTDQDGDSFDACNDFTSSTSPQDPSNGSSNQTIDQLSGANNAPDNKTINQDDDSFDAWNDFTSSTTAQDPFNSLGKQTVSAAMPPVNHISETNLFSTSNNSQYADLDSFLKPSFFSGGSSNKKSYEVNLMQSEASISNRMDDDPRDEGNADAVPKGEDVSNRTTGSKLDDVEMLMSQMHDLSFMLQSNLSIPSKTDGFSSTSKD